MYAPSTYELLQQLEDSLLALKPANSRNQWWLGQAMTLAAKIGDTRWLLAQQVGQGTPKAFLALLMFWLTLLFASFGLFAPPNLTSAVTLTLCALAVAGAIGMILELERGFGGLIHVSPQPMRQAVKTLEAELTANGPIADIEPYSRAARPTPVDLESQGVAVIAENISAMFAHQLLASPRPRLLLIDLSPMSGVTLMRVQ